MDDFTHGGYVPAKQITITLCQGSRIPAVVARELAEAVRKLLMKLDRRRLG